MGFHDIAGQEKAKRILQQALRRRTVSHAYLFGGPPGTGRLKTAMAFAQALFCTAGGDDACGDCLACRKFLHGNEPDLHRIEPDGTTIKIDQIRELQRDLSFRNAGESRKIYIMEQAERMTPQAANSLLKFLEEPVSPVVAILITDNVQAVLPTIRSRAQLVPFLPMAPEQMLQALLAEGRPELPARAAVHLVAGLDACRTLLDQDGFAETRNVVIQLGKESLTRPAAAMITAQQQVFKTNLGERPELMFALMGLWYRDLIRLQAGRPESMVYIDQKDWLQKIAFARSAAEWVACMEYALEAVGKVRAHVPAQLAFEQFMVHVQEGKVLV